MKKIVFISDTHGCQTEIVNGKKSTLQLPTGDVLIHCGDYSSHGDAVGSMKFNAFLESYVFPEIFVLPGNHDIIAETDPLFTKSLFTHAKMVIDEPFMIGGRLAYATPWQPNFHNWAFNVERELTRVELFSKIPDETEILISHVPPYGILDLGFHGDHAGDKALLGRVKQLKNLKIHAFGHLHNSYGMVEMDGVKFINCSLMDDKYRMVHRPIVVDI